MAQTPGKTVSTPTDLEVKIHFQGGGFTIIPKLNRDNFVRLNSNRISYIEEGGENAPKLPEVSVEAPKVEAPEVTKDPSMQWGRPKLLKHAKKLDIDYSKEDKEKGGVTKTEILSDILTKPVE